MTAELSTLFIDAAPDDALHAAIAARSGAIDHMLAPDSVCHVSVFAGASGTRGQLRYCVRVHASALDGAPVIGQGDDADCLSAVASAFDIAGWQLALRVGAAAPTTATAACR